MATEYNTRPGGGQQWRDKSRGVDGWNNIDVNDPNSWPPGYKPPAQSGGAAPKAAPVPVSAGGGGAPAPAPAPAAAPAAAPPESVEALNKIAIPAATAPMPQSVTGMGGAGGGVEGPSAGILGQNNGVLRPLGRRMLPVDSMALAGLQRRVY